MEEKRGHGYLCRLLHSQCALHKVIVTQGVHAMICNVNMYKTLKKKTRHGVYKALVAGGDSHEPKYHQQNLSCFLVLAIDTSI